MVGVVENVMYTINYILDTKRKRHIIGGVLISLSAFLGGLAVTVITIKEDKENDYEEQY